MAARPFSFTKLREEKNNIVPYEKKNKKILLILILITLYKILFFDVAYLIYYTDKEGLRDQIVFFFLKNSKL